MKEGLKKKLDFGYMEYTLGGGGGMAGSSVIVKSLNETEASCAQLARIRPASGHVILAAGPW